MRVVIAGAGRVGQGLAERLVRNKHDVVIVDSDREVCEQVYAEIGVGAIHGSATSISVLEDAELHKADCAVSLMRNDSDNLCFAVLANSLGVPRIVVRMRDPKYQEAYQLAGATKIISIIDLFVSRLLLEIEEPTLTELAPLGAGRASIFMLRIPESSPAAGKTIEEIARNPEFPDQSVIAGIYRPDGEEFIIPRGQAAIKAGDQVFLVANTEDIRKASRCLGVK